ncbi:MAG: hypothetical protein K0Q50_2726 [Vampirovibrio sp.]|jgi:hypothetical protein|nr:hypothetical protein [Vampirovibrio sp.]
MPQSEHTQIRLYDYDKLNTSSIFRRLTTDIHGEQLHDWPERPDGSEGKWRWLTT